MYKKLFLFTAAGFFLFGEAVVKITLDAPVVAAAALFFQCNFVAIETEINNTGVAVFFIDGCRSIFHGKLSLEFAGAAPFIFFEVDEELVYVRFFGIAYGDIIFLILHVIATEFIFPW